MSEWNLNQVRQLLEETIGGRGEGGARRGKRRRILQAARDLFTRFGYRKTSVDRVAQEAGVAKGTVYLYYHNKAELLMAVIAGEKLRLLEEFASIFDPVTSAPQRFRLAMRLMIAMGAETPLLAKLIGGDREVLAALDDLDAETRDGMLDLRLDFVRGLLDAAAAPHRWTDQELDDRAKVLIGLFFCASSFADERIRSGVSLERFSEILADMILDGIRPRDAGEANKKIGKNSKFSID